MDMVTRGEAADMVPRGQTRGNDMVPRGQARGNDEFSQRRAGVGAGKKSSILRA